MHFIMMPLRANENGVAQERLFFPLTTSPKHVLTFGWYQGVSVTMCNNGAMGEDLQPRHHHLHGV